MNKIALIESLKDSYAFFTRSSDCLDEGDSEFAPKDGMFTVSQQVAHAAQTVDWFVSGAFSTQGFSLDFDKATFEIRKVTSLTEARNLLKRSFQNAIKVIDERSDDDLLVPLPDGPVMSGAPRFSIVAGIVEHTAHHRGALTVYARLLDKTPEMPYS